MNKKLTKMLSLAVAALIGVSAYAQVTTSSMSGKITDENGPVAGATVVAVHQPTGSQFYAVTGSNGAYRLNNITAGGPYEVTVSCLGYVSVIYSGVTASLSDNVTLDAVLEEESLELNAVTVTAESRTSNMRSDRAGALTSLDRKQINSIPTVSRSLNDVLKLDPNSYVSGNNAYLGGASYRSSFVTVDGAAFNNAFGIGSNLPANGSPISIDALEQVSVSVTPFDVRQSGFTGGGVNAVTRSGSNKFEGSAYSYFNNEKFRGIHVGDTELSRSESQYLMYGARVGGPIIKDKLFFFLNVEVEKSVEPGPSRVASTPGAPYTNGKDGIARPSASVLDALSSYLKNEYGYETGPYQGYSSDSPGFKFLARVDWNINRNHKFNVRFSKSTSKSPLAPSTSCSGLGNKDFTSNNRQSMYALYYKNARYYQGNDFSSVAAELNSRFFDGKLNNVLRASWSNQNDIRETDGDQFPFVDVVVAGNTYTSFGTELFSYGNVRYVNTLNLTDEATLSAGIHNLLLGVQYEHNNTRNGFQRFGAGFYEFDFATEQDLADAIAAKTVFNTPAQFAITHSLKPDFSQAFPQFDFNQLSAYLQDEISFSDRFKLTAGLRIDFPMYPALETYNYQVAETHLAPTPGNPEGLYDTTVLPKTRVMWSPRVGFNWDILGNRNLVLRGGTGIFTGRIPFVWIVSQAGDSGVLQTTATRVASKKENVPSFVTDRVEMCKQLYGSSFDPATIEQTPISSCTLIDSDLRMPQTWKSSLALDVRLPWGIKGSIEGVFNYDINSTVVKNLGLKDPDWTLNSVDNRPIYGGTYDSKLTAAYMITNGDRSGWYYALTAKLSKTFDWGLDVMASYTHADARNIFDGAGDQPYSTWNVPYTVYGNNSQELSYAGYVMPHRLMISASYSKDYAKFFGTSVSLFYNGGPQGRTSYVYTSSIVGDGGAKNLIYVPKAADELTFTDYKPEKWDRIYTAEEQAADFWNYINQDKYLSSRKGQYAERNGVVYPWINSIDLKFNQNFYFYTGANSHKHTLQVGVDILNFANLLNKNWGSSYYVPVTALLSASGYKVNGTDNPTYQFQANGTEKLTSTYTRSIGFSSTWQMQLNLRYIF